MSPFRDIEHARDLAARTLAAIKKANAREHPDWYADQQRVTSDLAGIERHPRSDDGTVCLGCFEIGRDVVPVLRDWPCVEATSYTAGLIRTGRLYGQKP